MTAALLVECIGKSFAGRPVLTSASLRADEGCITALVGRNGIGKSTLLKIAAGWMRPDHGTVHYKERCRIPARLHRLAGEGLFYLPDRDLLSPGFTVREHLTSGQRRWGRRSFEAVGDATGIQEILDRRPPALSTGQRRSAGLALVLLRRPDCLLADEPYRGLAPLERDLVSAVLRRLAADGCAVVVTGHEVPTLFGLADRIVWCTDGTTHDLGTPTAAGADWRFRREYLGLMQWA